MHFFVLLVLCKWRQHFFVLLVLCKWRHIRPLVSMYAYIVLHSLLLLFYGCILDSNYNACGFVLLGLKNNK